MCGAQTAFKISIKCHCFFAQTIKKKKKPSACYRRTFRSQHSDISWLESPNHFFFHAVASAKQTVNTRLQVALSDGLTVWPGRAAHKSITGSDEPALFKKHRSKHALSSMLCKTGPGFLKGDHPQALFCIGFGSPLITDETTAVAISSILFAWWHHLIASS